uniref:Zinc finger MYM-type protein 5 n=1 Tax=Noccaea caerulescens TaxID=107243 RepID=A0A1J3JM83_NOCCA
MPPSGHDKRQKKKHVEKFIQSQKGSLDQFVVRKTCEKEKNDNTNIGASSAPVLDAPEVLENFDDVGVSNVIDIYDPRNWDMLDLKLIEALAINGPKRDLSIVKGPKNKVCRRFVSSCYTRELPNGETSDRKWLVYSKELDKAFCFCCKIFKKGIKKSQLGKNGLSDWTHILVRLKEHEKSKEHLLNMTAWIELRHRLKKNETIDKVAQELFKKEKDYWKNVLIRIIAVMKYLAKHNLAFRGTHEKLYQNSNGNFLGLIETLAKFDSVIKEHVYRITSNSIQHHYLSHKIQNELILLIASRIKSKIIAKVKEAKYFSVILDCTPDASHQEQMTLILSCFCREKFFKTEALEVISKDIYVAREIKRFSFDSN